MTSIRAALTAALIVLTGCTAPLDVARPDKPLPSAAPAQAGLSAERLERMGGFFRSEVEKSTAAGYVLLVARHGKLVYSSAVGMRDREQGLPMTLDTRFRIMSMTKPVTSVAVLMLCEQGLLQLDDPVSRYLPEFADARVFTGKDERGELKTGPAKQPITIRHLLTHMSGLGYGPLYDQTSDLAQTWGSLDLSGPGSLADKVRAIAALPLYSQPGEQWRYSYADDVLGRVVEVVSGQPFDRFLKTRLFEPLGMRDTSFWIPESDAAKLARVYVRDAQGSLQPIDGRLVGSPHDPAKWPSGGHGLISTAGDYLRFAQMLANGGSFAGRQYLSPVTVALMTSNQVAADALAKFWGANSLGLGYGMGVAPVIDAGVAAQANLNGDYSWGGLLGTQWLVSPQSGIVAVLMTQLNPVGNAEAQRTYADFRNLLYAAVATLDPIGKPAGTGER
jgi:CubicO group peptidase (beta-lactamase class C family)